jgi:hypothetical protein
MFANETDQTKRERVASIAAVSEIYGRAFGGILSGVTGGNVTGG